MELYDVFRNQALKHFQMCQSFIDVLKHKPYTDLTSLFLSIQTNIDKVVSKKEHVVKESEDRRERYEWVRQYALIDERNKQNDKGITLFGNYKYNIRVISWVIYYGHHRIIDYLVQQTDQHNETSELFGMPEDTPSQFQCQNYKKKLISNYRSKREKNIEKFRLLVLGCYSGDLQTVRTLLPVCKETINMTGEVSKDPCIDWCHYSPLAIACMGGNVSMVAELVQEGADVNLLYGWESTPLMTACELGHVNVVEELVEKGADVDLRDRWGNVPLIIACKEGHTSVVKEMLKAKADVNQQDALGNTPLKAAVAEGSLSVVKCLVDHGANWVPQAIDSNASLIYKALILNRKDILKYLIQKQNELSYGKYHGNIHLFNCLINFRNAGAKTDHRGDVVLTNKLIWSMEEFGDLWRTVVDGGCNALSRLLCVGLDSNQLIQLSEVAPFLHTLIDYDDSFCDRAEKVRVLLEAGADVNVKVRYREYDALLDREGVSVLERTRRWLCKYRDDKSSKLYKTKMLEFTKVIWEIKKRVRRYSV
jgi:ankyrin repeat protein